MNKKINSLPATVDVELFSKRIKRISKEISHDNIKIANLAAEYNKKYEDEIAAGTTMKQLLLAEGAEEGLTSDQVTVRSGFIPTVHTPVLNWLHYFMSEHKDNVLIGDAKEVKRRQLNERYAGLSYDGKTAPKIEQPTRHSRETPDMYEYLYGNVTSDIFDKLKKLKAMSQSDNENEAFQAYRAGNRLCKEHGLDFDKVPSPYKK